MFMSVLAACTYVHHVCIYMSSAHGGQKRASDPPGTCVMDMSCGYWESKSVPLQDQQIYLTIEPSQVLMCFKAYLK